MTWADLFSDLKVFLGTSQQWEEGELMLYTNWAIRTYSDFFPQETSTTLTTDGSLQEWDTPSGFLSVNRVAFYEGGDDEPRFLEEIQIKPGTEFYDVSSQYPLMWHVEAGKFKLTSAPDSNDVLTLHYFSKHTEMAASGTVLTVPDRDIELLCLYVASRATARVSVDDARLSRWDQSGMDSGNPTHNPLLGVHRQFEREFWNKVYSRLPTGMIEFHRKGRGA